MTLKNVILLITGANSLMVIIIGNCGEGSCGRGKFNLMPVLCKDPL